MAEREYAGVWVRVMTRARTNRRGRDVTEVRAWQGVARYKVENPKHVEDSRPKNRRHEYVGRGAGRRPNPDYLPDARTKDQRAPFLWLQETSMLTEAADGTPLPVGIEVELDESGNPAGAYKRAYEAASEAAQAWLALLIKTQRAAEAAAQALADEAEAEALATEAAARAKTTYDYVREYIDGREARSAAVGYDPSVTLADNERVLQRATIRDYSYTCERLRGRFSKIALVDLTRRQVRDWENDQLTRGVHPRVVRKCHILLNAALEYAVRDEAIAANPMAGMKPPRPGKPTKRNLSQEGMQTLTARLLALEPTATVCGAFLALHCGLRCGEVCALTWGDIDLDKGRLLVTKSIGTARGGAYLKPWPKTAASVRVVYFGDELTADMLTARKRRMEAELGNVSPLDFNSLYVCGNVAGEFANPTRLSKEFTALSRSWGLLSEPARPGEQGEPITMHSLRHSYVVAMRQAGAVAEDAQANAGHSSITTTLGTYSNATEEGRMLASQLAAEYMRPATMPKAPAGEVLDMRPSGTEG